MPTSVPAAPPFASAPRSPLPRKSRLSQTPPSWLPRPSAPTLRRSFPSNNPAHRESNLTRRRRTNRPPRHLLARLGRTGCEHHTQSPREQPACHAPLPHPDDHKHHNLRHRQSEWRLIPAHNQHLRLARPNWPHRQEQQHGHRRNALSVPPAPCQQLYPTIPLQPIRPRPPAVADRGQPSFEW